MIRTGLMYLKIARVLALQSFLMFFIFMSSNFALAQDDKTGQAGPKLETAVFAGGCFWCMEPAFEKVPGVTKVLSGYAGGAKDTANYKKVSAGQTKHAEVVEVTYIPNKVSYEQLLAVFWKNIDPTTANRQFCDAGTQYRSAIFYSDKKQEELAKKSKETIASEYKLKVVTEVVPLDAFYPAEDYHQDFYKKNPLRYRTYRMGCGRDRRLEQIWGGAKK